MTAHPDHTLVSVVVGTQEPVTAVVHHEPEADMPHDSGFTILLADAPDADDLAANVEDDPRVSTICLHCAVDTWPEAGRGLDLARQHGGADRDPETGEWST